MATLEQLGFRTIGSYISGKKNVLLSDEGSKFYNDAYPADPPIFSDRSRVVIKSHLPPQESTERITVSTTIFSVKENEKVTGLVFFSTDDHFRI